MSSLVPHRRFLAAAIRLGMRHSGQTWPNPAVGCLIVKDGIVVGAGATGQGGRPHGETVALKAAGAQARGATAYVSLEPCNHVGRTGPCTHALEKAGIAQVVIALGDPDTRVSGSGVAYLRDAGIDVVFEPFADLRLAAQKAHRGHIMRMAEGRPFVTLKLALSRDGGIGISGKGQTAITSRQTNRRMHGLRTRVDAMAVGAQTVRADDPQLTVRLPGLIGRLPVAVVFGDVDLDGKKLSASRSPDTVIHLPSATSHDLNAALAALGQTGLTTLLVEGGARLARSFLDHNLVDEVILLQGAVTLGETAIRPFRVSPFDDLEAAGFAGWTTDQRRNIGADKQLVLTRNRTEA